MSIRLIPRFPVWGHVPALWLSYISVSVKNITILGGKKPQKSSGKQPSICSATISSLQICLVFYILKKEVFLCLGGQCCLCEGKIMASSWTELAELGGAGFGLLTKPAVRDTAREQQLDAACCTQSWHPKWSRGTTCSLYLLNAKTLKKATPAQAVCLGGRFLPGWCLLPRPWQQSALHTANSIQVVSTTKCIHVSSVFYNAVCETDWNQPPQVKNQG